MPVYQSPGVYVEYEPAKSTPIAGVGTSTAGFIGIVPGNPDPKMPLIPGTTNSYYPLADAQKPILITGWEQFKNSFGDFQAKDNAWQAADYDAYRRLQHAVYGFFNNGGTRCWVIRDANFTKLSDNLKLFESIDEIAIVAVPGVTAKNDQELIIDHCEKALDRVAILDAAPTPADFSAPNVNNGTKNSGYAALYFPWIRVTDPATGTVISQPPSGHLAGIYSRVDAERGVYKAPANEVIRGAVDLDHMLSKADQDGLNPSGVNVLRLFNKSIKIWGARTLGGDANGDFRYLSTRRYFNFLRKSIDQGTQWVVFEPNTPALWQRITRSVGDFLLGQWRDGALFGDTPKQAFFVKCDADINTTDVRDRGQVITEIGVSIVKPAEFVIFRIQLSAVS